MDDMEDDTPDPLERDDMGRFTEPEPEPEPKPVRRKATTAVATSSLEGTVVLASLVYRAYSRKSASVLLLQDRLAELGHADARSDLPGWLSDGTVAAIREFQGSRGIAVTGEPDRATVEAIMAGTAVEVLP